MVRLVVMLFLFLLFSGCTVSKKEDLLLREKELPSWYLHPPKTTKNILYAVGEAQNREAAIKNALSMMASTLSVSVASKFHSKKVVREGVKNSYQTSVFSEIESDVKKIRLSSYEVVEAKKLGFRRYIVLIRSYKQKLLESFKNELDQRFRLIEAKLAPLDTYHALKRLFVYKNIKMQIADVPDILTVMNVLKQSFDTSEYLMKVERIESAHEKIASAVSFSVVSDGVSEHLQAPLKKGVSAEKFQIKEASGKNHFSIFVGSETKKAFAYGFTLARTAIEIVVRDHKNSIVGSNKMNITGQSTQGYEIAKQSVAVKLQGLIEKEGLYKVLGLKL